MNIGETEKYNGITKETLVDVLADWVTEGEEDDWWTARRIGASGIEVDFQISIDNALMTTVSMWPVKRVSAYSAETDTTRKLGTVRVPIVHARYYFDERRKRNNKLTPRERLAATNHSDMLVAHETRFGEIEKALSADNLLKTLRRVTETATVHP